MSKSFVLMLALFLTASCIMVAKPAYSSSAVAAENTWATKASFPISIDSAIGVTVVNGKIYAMSFSLNYEYDPITDKWTGKASMPTPRANFAIAAYQNKIYTMGGSSGWTQETGTIYSRANEVYDTSTDTWENTTQMPTGRKPLTASVVDGKIHLFSLESHDIYNIATDSWTAGKEMPYQVAWGLKSAVMDDKIYVISYNRTQLYDSEGDTWSLGAVSPVAVSAAAVCATTGVMAPKRIYAIGGSNYPFDSLDVTQAYDPESDTWMLGEPMPTSRATSAAVVNDQIYVIGGSRDLYHTSNANEQYTPFGFGTVPPVIQAVSPASHAYNESYVSLVFTVNKPVNWMGYSLDGGETLTVAGNVTLEGLDNGVHNVTVYAKDEFGNVGASENISFTVDVPFPTALVLTTFGALVAIIGVGLAVYFKKRKH